MSSTIHPPARTTPKTRQEIKDSGLSDREAAMVFNITRATAAKWLKRDDVQDRSLRTHTLHTSLSAAQEAIVLSLRQTLYLRSTTCSTSLGSRSMPTCNAQGWPGCSNAKVWPVCKDVIPTIKT